MIGGTRVDFWRHTLMKRAFMGSANANAAGLGERPMVELWNPVDSGKILFCQSIQVLSDVATGSALVLADHNLALINAGIFGNKHLNEAAGVGLIKETTDSDVGTDICNFYHIQNTPYDLPFLNPIQPILISEGRGLIVKTAADCQNDLFAMFQWIEV